MRRMIIAVFLAALILPYKVNAQNRPTFDNSTSAGGPVGGVANQTVDPNHPLPVTSSPGSAVVGTTTWTKTTVTESGSSKTLLAASTTRTGVIVYNSSANATVWIDPSGGAVAAEAGIPVLPGTWVSFTGSTTPKTAITTIGTNLQTVTVWEGN